MRSGSLEFLDLSYNSIDVAGCEALAEAEWLSGLRGLRLSSCGITAKGARALLESSLPDRLGYLDLQGNPFGPRDARALDDRLGECVTHDYMDGGCRTDSAWARRHLKAHPPRCLHGFKSRAGSPLARRVLAGLWGKDPGWFAFELGHAGRKQRAELLGYLVGEDVLVGPLAIRWQPSGEVVELFDTEQHGFAGECGGSTTITGRGERVAWRCPHDGCREHTFVVCFLFFGEEPYHPFGRYFPVQEQFRGFTVGAYCRQRDAVELVTSFECK
jgi:hypothetical protein